jgi:hypothetical protein
MKSLLNLSLAGRILEACVKVKVKLSLCFNSAPNHEGVLRSGGIARLIT